MPNRWRTLDVVAAGLAPGDVRVEDRFMRSGPRMIFALGLAGAAVLVAIGLAYALNPYTASIPPEPVGWWLATLAFIGGIALGATSFWQWQAEGFVRLFFVVILAGLSAGWIAASVLGILASRSGLPLVPIALHWIGLSVSTSVFLLALVEATRSLRALPGRGTLETSPLPAPHRPE
ncbi:MAG TPA: hypothetical protein VHI54_10585 [Actinomycetota bacterium]|nr:hypothetical protein [Actinomycetota bacterium]